MPPQGRSNSDRFVIYFSGVAIGCVLVGLLMYARARMANQPAKVTMPGESTPAAGPATPPAKAPQTNP